MSILEDLLSTELTEDNIRITVEHVFNMSVELGVTNPLSAKTRSIEAAKSLRGCYTLVKQVVENYEDRGNTPEVNRVTLTEEEPDAKAVTEVITWSLVSRVPGAFGQGAPGEASVRNRRPVIREEKDDPENPGYRLITMGYWHDNIVRLTCWAQTNKAANARAEWLEGLMEEYSWYFKLNGVDRFMFNERHSDIVKTVDNNKWYGRPIDYFVRTETLRVFSEKKLQEILIKVAAKSEL